MTRIQHRRGRHFMDEEGRLFWINGPEDHCYLSEQRQWRRGLRFEDVLEWKQCAPTGCVSQRFASPTAACEAFEHAQVVWSHDVYLRRMGEAMARHRSLVDYKPTAMRLAEARGAHPRQAPWSLPQPSGPVCELPTAADTPLSPGVSSSQAPGHPGGLAAHPPSMREASEDVPHPRRRRRGGAVLSLSG